MQSPIQKLIAEQLNLQIFQVSNTIQLLDEKATVPFISRYRKEKTGSLDEVEIGDIKNLDRKYTELEKRKITIVKSIAEQNKLSPELEKKIEACWDAITLEDIYLPFKPKRKTRASLAKERGLEPLALIIYKQNDSELNQKIDSFLNEEIFDTSS